MEGHAAMTRSGSGMRPERGHGTGVAPMPMHRWQSSPQLAGIKPGPLRHIANTRLAVSQMDRILERAASGEYGEDSDVIGKLAGIVRAATFESSFGPFICGTMGGKDVSGLHEGYLICPTYGADAATTALFKRATANQ